MLIRAEIPIDASKIDLLLRDVFPSPQEADLVKLLRENGQLTLGVVAADDSGDVLGYAAFSPMTCADGDLQWVGLAPLAVKLSHQQQGIGQRLVYESLDILNEFGYCAVVVLGDPNYYSVLGFEAASHYGLSCRWAHCEKTLQLHWLDNRVIRDNPQKIDYCSAFDIFLEE